MSYRQSFGHIFQDVTPPPLSATDISINRYLPLIHLYVSFPLCIWAEQTHSPGESLLQLASISSQPVGYGPQTVDALHIFFSPSLAVSPCLLLLQRSGQIWALWAIASFQGKGNWDKYVCMYQFSFLKEQQAKRADVNCLLKKTGFSAALAKVLKRFWFPFPMLGTNGSRFTLLQKCWTLVNPWSVAIKLEQVVVP